MRLILSKFIRAIAPDKVKTMPDKCYAMFYLPKSTDDICDCINHCKYNPRGDGIKYKFKIIKYEITDQQQISLKLNN